MEHVHRREIDIQRLPGRSVQKAIGKASAIESRKMSVGFARYDADFGPMEPHQHAEETVYILSCRDGRVRHGSARDDLTGSLDLEAGMMLHFPELEWHVFEYGSGGFIDIIFIYGQVDNIRPEEILR